MLEYASDKMNTLSSQIQDERKLVSELILNVLERKLCSREALEKFPRNFKDSSLQSAWHALIHYEADEDIREKDTEYAQEQDNYLKTIAFILQKGEPLPENTLQEYNKYYGNVVNSESKNILSKIKSIFRYII